MGILVLEGKQRAFGSIAQKRKKRKELKREKLYSPNQWKTHYMFHCFIFLKAPA